MSIEYYILVVINFNVYVLIDIVGYKKLYFYTLSPKVGENLVALKPLYTQLKIQKNVQTCNSILVLGVEYSLNSPSSFHNMGTNNK